jgi:excinuclease ABC subunit A
VDIPLGVMTAVTGVSGSGKSTLVSQVVPAVVSRALGLQLPAAEEGSADPDLDAANGVEAEGLEALKRLVVVDQKPIGRTPRSNLATYTGLFDVVRKLFADTALAKRRGWGAGRFSFNLPVGRCETCQGEGLVSVELFFLPGSYAPCPTCHGARYAPDTLRVKYKDKSIADVLALSVEEAAVFFADDPRLAHSFQTLLDVGLGYLRLGQPAPELSGGEAQRIKLATELQRNARGHVLYVLDEPTNSLHPADVELLLRQLHRLVDGGHSVLLVEHDMRVVASADWLIDMGPGGGDAGGKIVVAGPPLELASAEELAAGSRSLPFLRASAFSAAR